MRALTFAHDWPIEGSFQKESPKTSPLPLGKEEKEIILIMIVEIEVIQKSKKDKGKTNKTTRWCVGYKR